MKFVSNCYFFIKLVIEFEYDGNIMNLLIILKWVHKFNEKIWVIIYKVSFYYWKLLAMLYLLIQLIARNKNTEHKKKKLTIQQKIDRNIFILKLLNSENVLNNQRENFFSPSPLKIKRSLHSWKISLFFTSMFFNFEDEFRNIQYV